MPATQKYIKINGVLTNFQASSMSGTMSSSEPDQLQFSMVVPWHPFPLAFNPPLVGQTVELFLRDDTKIFGGTIDSVDSTSTVEFTNQQVYLTYVVKAVGFNNRLYMRTTYNWTTGLSATYSSFVGYVDVDPDGVTCHWRLGNKFGPGMVTATGEIVGKQVKVNGTFYVCDSVPNPNTFILHGAGTGGALTDVPYDYTLYSSDVIEDLLNTYCAGEGFTYIDLHGGTMGDTFQPGFPITITGIGSNTISFDPPTTIADAIQKVLALNPTFYFYVDPNQLCYFGVRTLLPAAIDITDITTAYKRAIENVVSRADVRNREIGQINSALITNTVDLIVGDTVSTSWFTSKPIKSVVSAVLNGGAVTVADSTTMFSGKVNVTGTTVTWVAGDYFNNTLIGVTLFVIDGVDYVVSTVPSRTTLFLLAGPGSPLTNVDYSFVPLTNYFFDVNTNRFWQNPANAVLGTGDNLQLTYVAIGADIIAYADDQPETVDGTTYANDIAARLAYEASGTGHYDQIVSRTQETSVAIAKTNQVNSVERLRSNLQTITLETIDTIYRAGMSVLISIANTAVADTFFIDSIAYDDSKSFGTAQDFIYTLTCVSVARRVTAADVLRTLFSPAAVQNTSVGSNSTSTVVPGGAFQAEILN
jgi:hypothetical protein